MIQICENEIINNLQVFNYSLLYENKSTVDNLNKFCKNAIEDAISVVGEENIEDAILLEINKNDIDIFIQMKQEDESYITKEIKNAFYVDINLKTQDSELNNQIIQDFCEYNFISPKSIKKQCIRYYLNNTSNMTYFWQVNKDHIDLTSLEV